MNKEKIYIKGLEIDVYSLNTVVVGSGAAGFNAADSLYSLGQKDIAIITEGVNMGTSRNTGSDKQTYYKLTLAGEAPDSVMEMARTLFEGGSRHGDVALVEAALSAKCFYKLAEIGVPFPHNRYGEYIGYKTDHDPRQRATSAGPLTSRFMTEKLEAQVKAKNIKIFDGYLAIGILTEKRDNEIRAMGLVALNIRELEKPHMGFTIFNCTNIVYATGGPAGMYQASVYPESQTGASGIAFEAGVAGINLTESQFGIASIKFRWNLSGTYQQVIPRYLSANQDGSDGKEFLDEYFDTRSRMLDAIFLKGYQWPFDPRKIENYASSLIDILVYQETQIKGRRVFLDFMHNPGWACGEEQLDFGLLGREAYKYLENSDALFGTPVERLKKMNKPAIDLYMDHGIDLTREYLEIAVCAQHNNGGLAGNCWWESNVKHFFPVGEVNGSFGVYRPGGSALNSTQAGSLRSAQYICANYGQQPQRLDSFAGTVFSQVAGLIDRAVNLLKISKSDIKQALPVPDVERGSMYLHKLVSRLRARMSRAGAHIRNSDDVEAAIMECGEDLTNFDCYIEGLSVNDLPDAFRARDMLITQFVYLSAIREYIKKGGKSRGSYLIRDASGRLPAQGLPEELRYSIDDGRLIKQVCEISLEKKGGAFCCRTEWMPVRPIPEENSWFENVWNEYMKDRIVK
ncbi:MAG: FAD-binding protein [Ruminiclostridium sp.]|nr:FAD-binding protein [Ruminiclostridium sp.]